MPSSEPNFALVFGMVEEAEDGQTQFEKNDTLVLSIPRTLDRSPEKCARLGGWLAARQNGFYQKSSTAHLPRLPKRSLTSSVSSNIFSATGVVEKKYCAKHQREVGLM